MDPRLESRKERVRILLRTRNDVYPTVPARAIPSTPAGAAPQHRLRCPSCSGSGRIRTTTVCPVCEGRGRIETDSYTGRVTGADARRAGAMSPQQVDAELSRLRGFELARDGSIDPSEAFGWERAKERRDRGASYPELERALHALRAHYQLGWELICWIYGSGLDVEVTPAVQKVADDIVGWLAQEMRGQIRIPKAEHEALKERKTAEVLALVDELEPDEIADRIAMSRHWVASVVAERRKVEARVC